MERAVLLQRFSQGMWIVNDKTTEHTFSGLNFTLLASVQGKTFMPLKDLCRFCLSVVDILSKGHWIETTHKGKFWCY